VNLRRLCKRSGSGSRAHVSDGPWCHVIQQWWIYQWHTSLSS